MSTTNRPAEITHNGIDFTLCTGCDAYTQTGKTCRRCRVVVVKLAKTELDQWLEGHIADCQAPGGSF